MNESKKRELIKGKYTLEGCPCNVAGCKTNRATLSADFAGFWSVPWEAVERVAGNGGNFTADDVMFDSFGWLGLNVDIPEPLRVKCGTGGVINE